MQKCAIGILFVLLCCSGRLSGQEGWNEIQVPFDPEGKVLEISPQLRQRLGLFPEVENFHAARLFRRDAGAYLLQIDYRLHGQTARHLQLLSAIAADSLRRDLSRRLEWRLSEAAFDQAGRGEFIFDQIVLSLWVYGNVVPFVLGIDEARPYVAAYMLTGAAGFYVPYHLTRRRPVTLVHRQTAQFGASRGLVYGWLLKNSLIGEAGGKRGAATSALGTSVAGTILSFWAVDRRHLTPGQAELCAVMGDFGLLGGWGSAYLMGLLKENQARGGQGLILLSSGAGLYHGYRLGRSHTYTRGDAYVLRAGGLLGALTALPLVNATGTKSPKAHVGGALAGLGAGLGVTDRLLASQEFTFSQGLIVTAGQLAGGLLGLGVTYLLDTQENFDELVYLSSAAAGGLAGFTLTFRVFSR